MFKRIRKEMKNRALVMNIIALLLLFAATVISFMGIFINTIPPLISWAIIWAALIINWQAETERTRKEKKKNVLMDFCIFKVGWILDDIRDELYQENPCNETMLKDCERALDEIHECYKELEQC